MKPSGTPVSLSISFLSFTLDIKMPTFQGWVDSMSGTNVLHKVPCPQTSVLQCGVPSALKDLGISRSRLYCLTVLGQPGLGGF